MQPHHIERIRRLQSEMTTRGVEWLFVEPSVGFLYLTGREPLSLERLMGLLIPSEGELRLLTPLMHAHEMEAIPIEQFSWTDSDGPERATASVLADVKRLHVQGSLPAWALMALRSARSGIEVELDPGTLGALRERKDAAEIDRLRRSGEATDDMVGWVASQEITRLTERELGGRIRGRYLELGLEPTPHGLVASGANSADPHYLGGDVPIASDVPLLMDIGCALDGYWSDITRICFPDDVDAETERAYDIVCSAYDAAFAAVAPGVPCQEVDRAARRVIEEAGYGEAFVHRTGHGIGLEVHEPPFIREGNEQRLEIGHAFSIEPGIYVVGRFGVRYENIVALTEEGPLSLNESPRRHPLH